MLPGNLRKKSSGRGSGRTERDYLRARQQILRESQICAICCEAIDLTLKPICRFVKTDGFGVQDADKIPLQCGPNCDKSHGRKANPWSGSADHKIPVDQLPPDSPLLVGKQNLQVTHLYCNRSKGNRVARPHFTSSNDWY